MYHLGARLKRKAQNDPRPRNEGLRALTWNYSTRGKLAEPSAEEVLKEINGYHVANRQQLTHIKDLKNDGSTVCGAWIYCGVFPKEGYNRALERKPKDLLGHGWGFAWPNDCRIIYNRASARPDGQPWSERKKLVWWDPEKKEWTGLDHPDYEKTTPPDKPANVHKGHGTEALGGAQPVHFTSRRLGLVVCAQWSQRWSAPGTLRAARVTRPKSTLRVSKRILRRIARSVRTILTLLRTMRASHSF